MQGLLPRAARWGWQEVSTRCRELLELAERPSTISKGAVVVRYVMSVSSLGAMWCWVPYDAMPGGREETALLPAAGGQQGRRKGDELVRIVSLQGFLPA